MWLGLYDNNRFRIKVIFSLVQLILHNLERKSIPYHNVDSIYRWACLTKWVYLRCYNTTSYRNVSKISFFLILRNEPEWNFWSMTATESNINTYKHTKESRIQMNLSSRKHKMRYLRICISFKSVLLFILTLLLSSYLFNVFAHQRLLSINDDHTCFVRPNLFRCVTKAEWMYRNHTY